LAARKTELGETAIVNFGWQISIIKAKCLKTLRRPLETWKMFTISSINDHEFITKTQLSRYVPVISKSVSLNQWAFTNIANS
jgi:hypothetical protein